MSIPRDHSGQCHGIRACSWHIFPLYLIFTTVPSSSPGWRGCWGCPSNSIVTTAKAAVDIPPNPKFSTKCFLYVIHWHIQQCCEVGSSVFSALQIKQVWSLCGLNNFPKVKWIGRSRTYCSLPSFRPFSSFWSPSPGVLSICSPFTPSIYLKSCSLLGKMSEQVMNYITPHNSHISAALSKRRVLASWRSLKWCFSCICYMLEPQHEAIGKEALSLLHKYYGLARSAMNGFP